MADFVVVIFVMKLLIILVFYGFHGLGTKETPPYYIFFRKYKHFYITYQKIGDVCLLVFDLDFFEVKKSDFFQNILFSKNHNF